MPHAFFDHTGDVGVRLHAASLSGLFVAGADAWLETVTHPPDVRAVAGEHVRLDAAEPDALLLEWLSELNYRFESAGVLVRSPRVEVERDESGQWHLEAELRGEVFNAERHHVKVLVKAVTWHNLSVEETAEGWRATVIFDI